MNRVINYCHVFYHNNYGDVKCPRKWAITTEKRRVSDGLQD